MIDSEIQKNYRKENSKNVDKVNKEHGQTVQELDLEDRVFSTTPRPAYITLKDHKPDFKTNPKVRLINPTKPDIGQIAMGILDNLVKEVRNETGLQQVTDTSQVID